jgi:hypothetical protein
MVTPKIAVINGLRLKLKKKLNNRVLSFGFGL